VNVLHVNSSVVVRGGTEVYLQQVLGYLSAKGCGGYWLSVQRVGPGRYVSRLNSGEDLFDGPFEQWTEWFRQFLDRNEIDVIHLHDVVDQNVSHCCLSLRPVVRSLHGQSPFCPGGGKFWRFSERSCPEPAGPHCFIHAYTEGCCTRNPIGLVRTYSEVQFETRYASQRYVSVVVMSDYMKSEAVKAGFPESKIVLAPYFTPPVDDVLQSHSAERRLLFVGRFIAHKGLHLMFRAIIPLLQKHPTLILDVVGDGIRYPAMESALEQAKACSVYDRIIFHGWKGRTEIDLLFRKAYITLFPSAYPEAFGIVGIESMMRGRPVVAFDVGGVSDWLRDGVSGFLVQPGNTSEYGARVDQLLNDAGLYQAMSRAGRLAALQKFTPDRHVDQLLAIYQNAKHASNGIIPSGGKSQSIKN